MFNMFAVGADIAQILFLAFIPVAAIILAIIAAPRDKKTENYAKKLAEHSQYDKVLTARISKKIDSTTPVLSSKLAVIVKDEGGLHLIKKAHGDLIKITDSKLAQIEQLDVEPITVLRIETNDAQTYDALTVKPLKGFARLPEKIDTDNTKLLKILLGELR